MSWKDVVNQERIKGMLRRAIARSRLAQSYIFSGPPGAGKDALAIEFAKTLLCEKHGEEACGQCANCKRVTLLQHPNLHLIFALPVGRNESYDDAPLSRLSDAELMAVRDQITAKANNHYHRIQIPRATSIKITSIRQLRRESSLTSFVGGRKVFIIMNAEDLRDEAANALLKTLEEPSGDSLIILTTSEPDRILPTILSRCQHLRLPHLAEAEIQDAIVDRQGIPPARAALIARLANGSYARALELLEEGVERHRNESIGLLRTALSKSRPEIIATLEQLLEDKDRADLEEILILLQVWLRDAMFLVEGRELQSVVNTDDIEALKKFVSFCPRADYVKVFQIIDRTISLLSKNVYIPLIFLQLVIELRNALKPVTERRRSSPTVRIT